MAAAFRQRPGWDPCLIVDRKDEGQEFWHEYGATYWPDIGFWERRRLRKRLLAADLTIVAGTCSLDLWSRIVLGDGDRRTTFDRLAFGRAIPKLERFCTEHRTAVAVTDSHLLREPEFWNDAYSRLAGLHVMAMPDLIPVIDRSDVAPYWPPVEITVAPDRAPGGSLRIGHSPSKPERRGQKGSDLIEATCADLGVELEIISGLSHQEAVKRKRGLDLFIDQVSDRLFESTRWHGGLGKSGLEALVNGSAVLTSGSPASTEPELAMPPVVWTNRKRFAGDLRELVRDPERVRLLGSAGRSWAEKNLDPNALIGLILRTTGCGE